MFCLFVSCFGRFLFLFLFLFLLFFSGGGSDVIFVAIIIIIIIIIIVNSFHKELLLIHFNIFQTPSGSAVLSATVLMSLLGCAVAVFTK